MAATLKIALVSRTIFYAPVWVAEQNGYFRDEGVEARFEIFDNAEKINEAMHAGQAQIAIASVEALVADAFKGGKYRIVASVAQKPPHFIIAQPGIKTVQDLRGKRFGVLSLLNATLTLPGIAGIVLTVGMAVDSNVLIYERIREEVRGGRTPINAIDAGFARALATILDSNITTFIAAAVLFYIGTGPVRGFAVTLGIGIITTVFTAFTLTRLIVAYWVWWRRPQRVPI